MPVIPFKPTERSSMVGAPDRSYNDTKASGAMFGAGIGDAADSMGTAIAQIGKTVGDAFVKDEEKQRAEKVAWEVAGTDLVTPAMKAREQASPDGTGVAEATLAQQADIINKRAQDAFPGDYQAQREYRMKMIPQVAATARTQAGWEQDQSASYGKLQTDNSLNTIYNKVRTDPSLYDTALEQGNSVVDTSKTLNGVDRETARQTFTQNLAATRFEGQLASAKTIDDVKGVEKELSGGDLPSRGLLEEGNIQLLGRPQVKNADGTISTVLSMSFNEDGKEVLIPTVVNGKVVSDEEAKAHYRETGEKLGVFDTPANADAYAIALHNNEAAGLWQSRLAPDKYKSLLGTIETMKTNLRNKYNAETTSEIATMRTRVDDLSQPPLSQEDLEATRRKIDAGGSETNTATVASFSKLVRDNELKKQVNGLPAYQVTDLANRTKGGPAQMYPNLPPEMTTNINEATKLFPGVSAAYLGGTATQEYGREFKKDGTTNYGVVNKGSNGAGTATGVYQFIDSTWNQVTKDPAVQSVMKAAGYANPTDPDLRKDPRASTIAAAALAAQNKSFMENALHRPVTDAELYMGHFMGAQDGAKFLSTYVTNRDAPAAAVFPAAADANRDVFFSKDGRPRTVAQVYDLFTTKFVSNPSNVQYGDAQQLQKIADAADKAQKANPIGYAAQSGKFSVVPLDQPGAWTARAATTQQVGNYYRIADKDLKPLDADTEVPQLKKVMLDGSAEDKAKLLGQISSMDKVAQGTATAAMRQLGEETTAYGVAGQLMRGDHPDIATASTVIRGQERRSKDESSTVVLGDKNNGTDNTFADYTKSSLLLVPPEMRSAISKAAEAHYIQTAAISGSTVFDKKAFQSSINAVMGGANGAPRIDTVNSTPTVLPQGIDGRSFDRAIDKLAPDDLISRSVDDKGKSIGLPPVYADGTPVKATDIAVQGKFRYVGDNTYQVQMSDNKFLVVAQRTQDGGAVPYRMRFDAQSVKDISQRATPQEFAGAQP